MRKHDMTLHAPKIGLLGKGKLLNIPTAYL